MAHTYSSTVSITGTITSLNQWNGNTISTNSGNKDDGTLRVVLVTDQPNFTTPLNIKSASNSGVTIGAVEIAAAQTLGTVTTVSTVTSLTQMNGQAIAMNTGVRTAGTQRVTIATDDLVPVNITQIGSTTISTGLGTADTGTQRINQADLTQMWVASGDSALTGSRIHYALYNKASSGKILRVYFVAINCATESAVTGLVARFFLNRINSEPVGSASTPTAFDTNNTALHVNVITKSTITSGAAATGLKFGSAVISSEETVVQDDNKILFDATASSKMAPIVLREGEGISVVQGALTGAAGSVGVIIYFTQQST